jgi:LDH2 family malate/lactate/ureidoglycolate dehydrogenase
MPADSTERVHLSVAEARALSEDAMRGIGYGSEEARILADHVIDAALCGYAYSGLPKLLTAAYFAAIRTGSRASSSAAARATAVPSKNRGFCVPHR